MWDASLSAFESAASIASLPKFGLRLLRQRKAHVPNVVRTGLDRTVDDLADAVDLGDDYPERVSSLEPVGVPSTCRVDAVLSLFDVLLGNLEVVERCTKRFGTARERVGDGLGALAGRLDAEG